MPTSSYPFWLGGVAASMAACCTHPLDLTKARMQTLETLPGVKHPSAFAMIRTSISRSGFTSLYAGLTASLLRQMTYSLVRLGSYEEIKSRISHPSTPQLLIAAAVAGGLGGIAGNPADILLVRMTTDAIRSPENRYGYSNVVSGFRRIIKDEGVQGLTRGLGANTARAVLMNISQVGSYDLFKAALLHTSVPVINYELKDGLVLHAIASTLAGALATTICSPADVLKSRIMSSSSNDGVLHVLSTSLREEGPRFLLKGWTPAFIRLGPQTVLLFVFFEQLKKAWSNLP
ncbi:mitochondrial carrier [Mycena floridula]|nr:mitochondrial carrier [Mycena floridula]